MPKKQMYSSVTSRGPDVSGKGAKGHNVKTSAFTMDLSYGGASLGHKGKMKGMKKKGKKSY